MAIPTYVRSDNSDAARQVDSANTVTNGKRINGIPESNREEPGGQMVECGVYHGGINTPFGLAKSLSIVNLGNLIDGNMFLIATEARKKEIRRNTFF